jgi:hypothetical protein
VHNLSARKLIAFFGGIYARMGILVKRRLIKVDGLIRGENLIAAWQTGLSGTDWLKALSREAKAVDMGGNGYLDRWVLSVEGIRLALANGIPSVKSRIVLGDDDQPQTHEATFKVSDRDFLANLKPEELLDVEVWDQS